MDDASSAGRTVPAARASRAASALSATVRIAMTGTPVENRLDELWSILHVTNPGLLGTRGRFRQWIDRPRAVWP